MRYINIPLGRLTYPLKKKQKHEIGRLLILGPGNFSGASHGPTSTASTKTWLRRWYTSMKLTARISTKNGGWKDDPFLFGMPSFQVRSVSFMEGGGDMMWWSVMISSDFRVESVANIISCTFNKLLEHINFIKLMHRAAHLQIILYTKWHPWVHCVYFKHIP